MGIISDSNKKRVLSIFSLVMINVMAIDSLRNLPTTADMGLSIVFYYILATLLFMVPCALVTAELATHRPQSGGPYVWVRDAFGPKWGFVNIWLQWIYNVVWYPTILAFIATNIAYLINPNLAHAKGFMVSLVLIMFTLATLVNFFGMRLSSWVSSVGATIGTIVPMFFIIALGITWLFMGKPVAIEPTASNFFVDLRHITNLSFLVVVLFSLMGLEMSAVHAESVKDPHNDYPKALLYSSIIIVVSLIFSSLAIAMVIPKTQLNIVTGLNEAFLTFLNSFHLQWLMPLTILLIILGGFCGMSTWVIGPTKGLVVAAEDKCAPALFKKRNQQGAPVVVLIAQWIIVLALCSLFYFFKFISTSYWILSDLTAQLALLFYILLFAAAIRLRYKTERNEKAFRIPGGNWGIWTAGIIGIITCIGAILLGFLPPDGVHIDRIWVYEIILIVGIIIFSLPPFFIYRWQQKHQADVESFSNFINKKQMT